jgi:thimet oligopeptidase
MLHDFTSVTADSVAVLTEAALRDADALVASAVSADPPTFATLLGTLEKATAVVGDASGRGAFMARVHPEREVRMAGSEAEERLTKWTTDLVFRRDLYEAVERYAATDDAAGLDDERARLLVHTMRDFRRAGHGLDGEARDRLQELRRRLVELEVEFGRNLDEWNDGMVVSASDLAGLPDEYVARLERRDGGYFVSLAYPDYFPFMRQAHARELRRALQHKFWNKATAQNRPLLEEAVRLRREIASLLGFATWADFAMEVKMAGAPSHVDAFYDSVIPGLTTLAERQLEALTELAQSEFDGDRVEPWDTVYLDNLQRKRDYGIDQDEVAAYFPLQQVVAGMFEVTGDVFELTYAEVADARAWHPDVTLYEIRDAGDHRPIAYFYADLFPRDGKFGHAAAFSITYGRREDDGTYRPPVAAIVANFTKPTPTSPSLLKHDEALTLWHEFGHILHFCLTTVDTYRFSGYDTEWDFVEAPSQIMENWMWEPDVLRRFARHHETGSALPDEMVERLIAARDLNAALFDMRQVFLGKLDLGLHAVAEPPDLMDVYRTAYRHTLVPFHEDTFFPAGFGHLMGGYDAGYYGYLWSRVYGDDMFSEFERGGIMSREVGRRYRNEVLATGGSRDAIDHLRAFLGREPSGEAFLRRLGIST